MKNTRKYIKPIAIILILLTLTACFPTDASNGLLSVHVLDVGQADSILIITPNQRSILIDAGEAANGDAVVSYLKKNGIDKIDLLVGTHPHADHIGGLSQVIEAFEIGAFYMPAKLHTTATFEELLLAADKKGLSINAAKAGIELSLDDGVQITFLSPIRDDYDNLNDWSAVLKLKYKDKTFLFTGDAEAPVEKELIQEYGSAFLESDYLKVPHHGSSTSSTQELLAAVKPDVAVFSLGKNNTYGFPHREVLERYEEEDILIYRTDLQGTIVVESDGKEIWSNLRPVNLK